MRRRNSKSRAARRASRERHKVANPSRFFGRERGGGERV